MEYNFTQDTKDAKTLSAMEQTNHTGQLLKLNFYALVVFCLVYLLLPLVWDDFAKAQVIDDAYYYLSISRNLAQGRGITYGGEWTNGFQPLWMFLLSPLFLLNVSPFFPVKIALFLSGFFCVLSGLVIYRSGQLLSSERNLPGFAAILWLSCIFALEQALKGLETGLYYFCLSVLIFIYLKRVRLNPAPSFQDWALMGLISGLCFLTRIDAGFILLPLWLAGFYYSWIKSRDSGLNSAQAWMHTFLKVGLGFLVFLAFALPWVGYNYWLWGNPLPASGVFASAQIHQEMTFLKRVQGTIISLLRIPLFYPFSWATLYWRSYHWAESILLALGIFAWGICWAFDRKLRVTVNKMPLRPLLVAGALLIAGYLIFIIPQWYITRYLSPLILLTIFYSSAFWLRYLGRKPAVLAAVSITLLAGALLMNIMSALVRMRNPVEHLPLYRFQNMDWIRKNIPRDKAIGAFQSGIYEYYLAPEGWTVKNLDGRVSLAALRALRDGRLDKYLQEQKIVYLIDWSYYLSPFVVKYNFKRGIDYRIITKQQGDYVMELLETNRSGQ